jgi:hypothetical protein
LSELQAGIHGGVVVAVGPAAHAGDGTDPCESGAIGLARVLAASVGVDDQAGLWAALRDRHVEGVNTKAVSMCSLMASRSGAGYGRL